MAEELETCTVETGELRVESRGVAPVIRGYAVVFNQPSAELNTPIGKFREQIAPRAMTRTLAEGVDLRALVDHNPEKPMGRLKAGTLRAEMDARGLLVEIDPPKTSYAHDIMESIRRGDVSGMSFAFRTLEDTWDKSFTLRTVTDMLVREVSIVTFPAYPQTDVAMRSLTAIRAGQYARGRTVAERMAWTKAQQR